MAISTNLKFTIYRNLYENTGSDAGLMLGRCHKLSTDCSLAFVHFLLFAVFYFGRESLRYNPDNKPASNEMNRALGHFLCTYRLNWARRASWGWWDEWDDTARQTKDSKCKPWRSEAEHATSRSQRLPTILSFTSGWGRNIWFLTNRRDRETNPESLKGSSTNHYPRAPARAGISCISSDYTGLCPKM